MATLLTLLTFVPANVQSRATAEPVSAQLGSRQSDRQQAVALPELFLQHFGFPCRIVSRTSVAKCNDDKGLGHDAEVRWPCLDACVVTSVDKWWMCCDMSTPVPP